MTTDPVTPAATHQATIDAALLVLKSMNLSLDDLTAAPGQRPTVPTFAEYVPVVSAQVTAGTLRAPRSQMSAPRWPR
jgi:integrase/recombinase XerC